MKKLLLLTVVLALPHFVWGQLQFRATLNGWNEVPPRDTPAFGVANGTLDLTSNLFAFNYSFEGLLAPQTGAHIHVGAPGSAGPVVYPLPLGSPASFSQVISEVDVSNLRGGNWYVNLHSSLYPGGEIRGQFVPVPEPSTYALGAAAVLILAMIRRRKSPQASPAASA